MRNNKEKPKPKDIGEENQELMRELERIQENIEEQEKITENFEKENQKLRMLQNFTSVFSKTQTSKDSEIIQQIIRDLEGVRALVNAEVQEIGKLKKERNDLTKKIEIIDLELNPGKPVNSEGIRKMTRERSYKDVSTKFL